MSAIAGDGMQREVHAVAAKAGIDPAHGLIFPEVVAESGKVDEFHSLSFANIPDMGMAVKDGFHLAMKTDDPKQTVRIEQIAIAFSKRVMHEENDRFVRMCLEIFGEPPSLMCAQQSFGFGHVEQ